MDEDEILDALIDDLIVDDFTPLTTAIKNTEKEKDDENG